MGWDGALVIVEAEDAVGFQIEYKERVVAVTQLHPDFQVGIVKQ